MVGKVDQDIAELAARQHGVVARRRLLAMGLSRQAVDKRVRAGRLHRVHRGVYAVGHRRVTFEGTLFAAVLACGEGAVVSHTSAAVLHRLRNGRQRVVHVTVPGRGGRATRRGMVIHRSAIEPQETGTIDAIPVTSPARTVLDLADTVTRRELERTMDEADYLRLDLSGLEPRQGRPGYGRLNAVLADHEPGSTLTRSELEEFLLAFCRRHGFERPVVNSSVEGHEVDFCWPKQRLIVEADGRQTHDTVGAFERDRVRDAELVVAGWRVLRITKRRLRTRPKAVERQLRALLG